MKKPNTDWERELLETPLGMNGFTDLTVKKIKGRVDMANKKKNRFSQVGVVAAAVALLGSVWLLREPLADIARGKQANAPASAHEWQDKEIRLSIQYFNKNSFMFEFGNRFAVLHPKVQFDIPPEPESYELEEYKQWLVKNKPDIVQVPLTLLKPLADEGLLLPLDERIQRDGFALDAFHAPVIQTIREAGAGKLYGFAPYFDTAALYYNRTLFERNGVKLPTDRMSWEDVLRLASRFGGTTEDGKPVYGLTTQDGSPFQLVMTIGETEGLRITGGNAAEPTINTPAWTRITDEVANAYRNGSISVESNITSSITMTELSKSSPFLSGRAAMTFMPSYYRSDIIAATERKLFGDDWGIVTQPVDSRNPDRASQFSLPSVFAITANSPNSEAAWALLQDFFGPEKAEQDAKLGIYRTFARLPDEMDQGPQGDSVFYKLNPDGQSVIANIGRELNEKTFLFEQALVQAGNEELQAVVKGDLSAADALKRLQAEAEAGQFGSAP